MQKTSGKGRKQSARSAVLETRPEYERLGQFLQRLREHKGLEQKPLSRSMGKPEQFLNKVEQGRQRIDVVELGDLLRLLGLDNAETLTETSARHPIS